MSGGFTPKLVTKTDPLSGQINVLASEHMMVKSVGVTLDSSLWTADANGDKLVLNGDIVRKVEATGKYGPYDGTVTTSEVQTVALGAASAGTVKLKVGGKETAAIAYDASAATIQTALEALPNIEPGDVTVTGGPWPASVTLSFGGNFDNVDVPQVTAAGTGLTGGTITVGTTTEGVGAAGIIFHGGLNLKDGDVLTGILIHGSVLEARIKNLTAEARAALPNVIFQ